MTKTTTDPITTFIAVRDRNGKIIPVISYSVAVQKVMGMTAAEARRLLKAMIDETIDVSTEGAPECRLAAAKLVQEEMKFRLANEGMTLLPYGMRDLKEALKYGYERASKFKRKGDEEPKKGGKRKGGAFQKIRDHLIDNPAILKMKGKDAVVVLCDALGTADTTTLNYFYRCVKLHKQGVL